MLELKLFEKDVYELINRSSSETKKINDKIQNLKSGQINTLKMILSLQERVREIEVQLGNMESDDWLNLFREVLLSFLNIKLKLIHDEGLQHSFGNKIRQQNRNHPLRPLTHFYRSSSSQTESLVFIWWMEFLGKSWRNLQKLLHHRGSQLQGSNEFPSTQVLLGVSLPSITEMRTSSSRNFQNPALNTAAKWKIWTTFSLGSRKKSCLRIKATEPELWMAQMERK